MTCEALVFTQAEIGETAWLVRTRYLTAVSGPVAKPAPKHHEAAEVTLTEEDVLQHVEGTFAESELRHPRDPTLRPVSVLPLLPDLSGRDLLAVQFDGHPTRDVRGVRGLTAAQKEYLARTAILKNLRVIVEGVKASERDGTQRSGTAVAACQAQWRGLICADPLAGQRT